MRENEVPQNRTGLTTGLKRRCKHGKSAESSVSLPEVTHLKDIVGKFN